MKQIIEAAKQNANALEGGGRWAYPIVLELQKGGDCLAIEWVLECLKIYTNESESHSRSPLGLKDYIHKARHTRDVLTSLQCDEIALELWHSRGGNDLKTALARLWWSICCFKQPEKEGAIMSAIVEAEMAVELLLLDPFDRLLLDRFLIAAATIYESHISLHPQLSSVGKAIDNSSDRF